MIPSDWSGSSDLPDYEEDAIKSAVDEEGILKSCDRVDQMVHDELDRGVPPERIVVGGFSQGCAITLTWALVGRERNNVAAILPLSGYFPLADRVGAIREARGESGSPNKEADTRKWFYVHGDKDALCPPRLYEQGKQELAKWVNMENVETHLYERLAHATAPAELRDMLAFLNKIVPP